MLGSRLSRKFWTKTVSNSYRRISNPKKTIKTSKTIKTITTHLSKLPIIHILGEPGSGKTSIGLKLKEYSDKFAIIELDDIDDPIALKMLNNPKYLRLALSTKDSDNTEFFNIKDKKGTAQITKLIKQYQIENKIVVITGLSIDIKNISITDKYFINIDPKILFKQLNLRTLNYIVKYHTEIKSLIENENPEKINHILLYKYNLRAPFLADYNDVARFLQNKIKQNKTYKLLFSDEIYNDIINKYN
jgi:adenylate kinase family enzyme